MSKKVFLGGTCAGSKWRDKLIPMLEIDYFNPVVDDWNEEAYQRELKEREECDFCLYVITPRMEGVYSIAEVIDDSNKRPEKTLFCVLNKDESLSSSLLNLSTPPTLTSFSYGEKKSLDRVGEMVKRNGGKVFDSLTQVAKYLNYQKYDTI